MLVRWDLVHRAMWAVGYDWLFFWGRGGGEDVDRNWQIIRGPLGQFGGNMELFRIIWVPNRDHYGSVGVHMVYWGLLGNHVGVRGPVRVSSSQWYLLGIRRARLIWSQWRIIGCTNILF